MPSGYSKKGAGPVEVRAVSCGDLLLQDGPCRRQFSNGRRVDTHVFRDGVLEAIGWAALGGPRTVGQPPPAQPSFHCRPDLLGGFSCD